MNNKIMRKGVSSLIYISAIACTLIPTLSYADDGIIVDKSNTDNSSQTVGQDSVIVGKGNTTNQQINTILGTQNSSSVFGAIAIGSFNDVNSVNSVSIGNSNAISGSGRGFILGNMNEIYGTGEDSYAYLFGLGLSNNGYSNCVAFGSALYTSGCSANNQFSVGGMTIGNLANGVLDSDAVNLGQVKSMISPMTSSITTLQTNYSSLSSTVSSGLANLQSQVTATNTALTSYQATTQASYTALQSQVSSLASSSGSGSGTASNQVQVDQNTADIAVHTAQITGLTEQTNSNTTAIAKNTADIATQGTQISTLADTQTKMIDFEQALANQTNENTKAIQKLDSRVTALEDKVNGLDSKAHSYAYSAAALAMSANINFNPFLDRQIGIGVASVGGRSALSVGMAVRNGNSMIALKVSKGSQMPVGASASVAFGF